MGGTGTGKTFSIKSFLDAGITPFVIFTENGMSTLRQFAGPKDACKIHWHYVAPGRIPWKVLISNARSIRDNTVGNLQKLPGLNKRSYDQLMGLLNAANNFTCDRCGKEFGDASDWGPDRALVLDSLTGLNKLCMHLQCGAKPVPSQPDWGVAMHVQLEIINTLNGLRCHFLLISHVDKMVDMVNGGMILRPLALGQKNSPQIPQEFDEVIMARREAQTFNWSTTAPNVDLKARLLPLLDKIPPSFAPLMEVWRKTETT